MNLPKLITKRLQLLIMPTLLLTMSFNATPTLALMTQEAWVENQFQRLTLEERIGQLFMVAAYSNQEGEQHQQHQAFIEGLIRQYNIGGLIFFQGNAVNQAKLTNDYQSMAKTPLLIAIDGEWGLGMRLRDAISYPRQMTLGAIQDNQLIYNMGAEIARQLKLLGAHINLAPVLDINTNPSNPSIGTRSFGDSKGLVASKGIAYIKGMQDNGILAVAKHFPGLGDTSKDSHLELPVIVHDPARLEDIELYPFQQAIAEGIAGIMIAHTYIPAYDKTMNRATSLSPILVTDLLQKRLGFKGLVFTDALNMKAISTYYSPEEACLMALQAGNDILLFPEDVPQSIKVIKNAIAQGKLDLAWVEQRVKKVLATKYQVRLHEWKPIVLQGLNEQLHTPYAHLLKQQLFEAAITLVANQDHLIPITKLKKHKIATLSIVKGEVSTVNPLVNRLQQVTCLQKPPTVFSEFLVKYTPAKHYALDIASLDTKALPSWAKELEQYTMVIVDLHNLTGNRTNHFGLQPELLQLLSNLQQTQVKVVVVVFGSVYSLELLSHLHHLVAAYQDDPVAEQVAAQMIGGALPMVGTLPIHIPNAWKAEWGIRTNNLQRLGYALPEAVQMDSQVLNGIQQVVDKAIAEEVMPGCQVLVARKGKIVWEKAFGYHTYAKQAPVTLHTLYDIASVSKVVGTLQAIMYLSSQDQLDITQKISTYLPELRGTNKKSLTIKAILAHQAGLLDCHHAGKVLLKKSPQLAKRLFSNQYSASYPNRIGTDLYGTHLLRDLMWNIYMETPIKKKKLFKPRSTYLYTDVSFHLMHRLVERLLQQPLEVFLLHQFYQSLGLHYMGYHPLERFGCEQIAPSAEYDFLRDTIIQGTVHDPQAAICGGVAGNAGIFSNAHDLAVVLQMNLQGGQYGGKKYINKEVIQQFTARAFKNNRRGLGWDKPAISGIPNLSTYASGATYGHLGFTGTAVWVDPTYELIYIFLSNRTYPTSDNKKLMEKNIRVKIQDIVYQSLKDVEWEG